MGTLRGLCSWCQPVLRALSQALSSPSPLGANMLESLSNRTPRAEGWREEPSTGGEQRGGL